MEDKEAQGTVPERSYGRSLEKMRPVKLTRDVMKNAQGSCLAEFGDTKVLCSATIEEGVPAWRKGQRAGWVTAEYSTSKRTPREYRGRKGRSMEIERLVGRSLRNVCDMRRMGEITVTVDCDVLQADGGTRTASITGGWVALFEALRAWCDAGKINHIPITHQVAAISMGKVGGLLMLDLDGKVGGLLMLDLDYPEDSSAEVDMNLVERDDGGIVEVQGTGERAPLTREELNALLDMGDAGIKELLALQKKITGFEARG